jgi:secondary thiamine-phosphate synthase enzyme
MECLLSREPTENLRSARAGGERLQEKTMPKSSTVTTRGAAVSGASASAGELVVRAETVTIRTTDRIELTDITERVMAFVRASGVREGTISVWSMHTTCAVFINEAQTALHADIKKFLDQAVARDAAWLHNDPSHSDCDRMNADSHLRAMLLGHSLTLQVTGGELALGQWQRVIVAELDGPRARTLRLQAMGIT